MSKQARLNDLREALREVETAKRALVANGQVYSIQGSHSVTSATFTDLTKQEASIKGQILRLRGVTNRVNYAGVSKNVNR